MEGEWRTRQPPGDAPAQEYNVFKRKLEDRVGEYGDCATVNSLKTKLDGKTGRPSGVSFSGIFFRSLPRKA